MAELPKDNLDLANLIFAYYERKEKKEARKSRGIGCSMIGYACERRLWYGFRWCPEDPKEGRVLRLFDTGKREEERIIAELRALGITVYDRDEDGEQYRVEAFGGHWSGYFDAILKKLPDAPRTLAAAEFKTHSDWSFKRLAKEGVEKAKPEHYAQCQALMGLEGLRRTIYIGINKNTDDIYVARLHYDAQFFKQLKEKAKRLITAEVPPERSDPNPNSWDCKFCSHRGFCHKLNGAQVPERTCRTCIHATPRPTGGWYCGQLNFELSDELQLVGCDEHLFIPDLLPWEFFQVSDDKKSISYHDLNGKEIFNHVGGKISDIPF